MDGIILVNKPSGWTSFDVVNRVRGIIERGGRPITGGRKRFPVGHLGTLDPLATGLLAIVLGNYTKRVPEFVGQDKAYEVAMKLGQNSTTGDEEGKKTEISKDKPTEQQIVEALQSFQGDIMQIPPAFSAIKVNGQRAYKLARAGITPEIKPRPAKIYSIKLKSYSYPEVQFDVEVSSGTYVRSLVEDIGKHLKTGAYMSGLRRTKVGPFLLRDAMNINDLNLDKIQDGLMLA
jgi:tRNA pseudouridine55 synthase